MLHRLVESLCTLALACTFALCAAPASAANPADIIIRELLSPDCRNDEFHPVIDHIQDSNASHQYMLLLIFKKDTGGQYFGNAKASQYGCIADATEQSDSAGKRNAVATGKQLVVATCPNDCVYPYAQHEAMSNGNDPLGPNEWGIVSAINADQPQGGPGRNIEVWQIAVTDGCHARSLYAFHTKSSNSLFERAYTAGDLLGEIVVGYKNGQPGIPLPNCR